jgi:hypothetical protein
MWVTFRTFSTFLNLPEHSVSDNGSVSFITGKYNFFLHDSFFTNICNDLSNHRWFLMEANILHVLPIDILPFPHNLRSTELLYYVCLAQQEIWRHVWRQRLSNQTEKAFASLPEYRLFRPFLWTSLIRDMATDFVNTVLFLILNNHATAEQNIVLNIDVKGTINK